MDINGPGKQPKRIAPAVSASMGTIISQEGSWPARPLARISPSSKSAPGKNPLMAPAWLTATVTHGAVRRRIFLENFIWIMGNKIENEDLAEMQDPF